MVNANKHRKLLNDTETRIKKQKERKLLLSNNAKKKYNSLSKQYETQHQAHNKTINNMAENKVKNKEAVIWI